MKIGVLNDIHGNLLTLEAVLDFFRGQGCDEVIGTGDVLTIGPDSIECLRLLRTLPGFHMVSGNHERCFSGASVLLIPPPCRCRRRPIISGYSTS